MGAFKPMSTRWKETESYEHYEVRLPTVAPLTTILPFLTSYDCRTAQDSRAWAAALYRGVQSSRRGSTFRSDLIASSCFVHFLWLQRTDNDGILSFLQEEQDPGPIPR